MILGTTETRNYSSIDEAENLIKELEATVSYSLVNKETIQTGEVIDCPIDPSCFEKAIIARIGTEGNDILFTRLDGSKTFSVRKELNDQMREAMRESRLVIGYKDDNGDYEPQPLAINALPSLVSQAIGGKSSVLCQTEDKSASKQMRTEIKTAILNEFFALRKDKCKVYNCDGMARYVASDNYVYLPISELLETLDNGLKADFPDAEFVRGSISHQYSEFLFVLNDKDLKDEIANILGQTGRIDNYEPAVLFCTSNTGDSGANLHPVLLHGKSGYYTVIEEPETMEHVGSASIEKFASNVAGMMALFKATPDRLEGLSQYSLKHPAKAYKNVAFKSNFPIGVFAEAAADFETVYGSMASALDLYFELSDKLYTYAQEKNMDVVRRT